MSMRTRLIVILSIVLTAAFLSTSLITYFVARSQYRDSSFDAVLPLLTNNILTEIQRDLMRPIDVSSTMAADTFLRDWILAGEEDLGQIQQYLTEIRDTYQFFTAFYVSDLTGHYYYPKGILKTISRDDAHDVWYYIFKESGLSVDLDVDTDEASDGTLTIFINHRIHDYEGRFLGVTGVGLSVESISSLLSEYQERFGRLVYMISPDGVVQAHPDVNLVEQTSIHEIPGIREVASDILTHGTEPATYEIHREGDPVYLEARYFPEFDWYILGEQETSQALGRLRSTLFTSLAIGLLTTGCVIAIVILVINRYQGRLETLVAMDELTGIANRRHFMTRLRDEVARSDRYAQAMSLLMIDVDHFKLVNDTHGHLAGDRVLKGIADAFREQIRETDILGRVGGEEFGVILPQSGSEEAQRAAERMRESIAQRRFPIPGETVHSMTISIGVATRTPDSFDFEELLKRADEAMYRAKAAGRNRVSL